MRTTPPPSVGGGVRLTSTSSTLPAAELRLGTVHVVETTSAPGRGRWHQAAIDGWWWWVLLLVTGGVCGLLVVENAAYWLWVAHSAFLGIRDDPEPILGLFSVAAALAPVAVVGATWWATGRRPRGWVRRLCLAFGAGLPVVMMTIVIAAFMMGPF